MKYLFVLCSLLAFQASAQIWRYPPSYLPYGDERNPEWRQPLKGLKSQEMREAHYNDNGSEIYHTVEYHAFDEQGNKVLSWESYTDSAGTNSGDTVRNTYNDRGFWDQAFVKGERIACRTFLYNEAGNVTEIRTIRKDTSVVRYTWDEKQRIVRADSGPGYYATWAYNPDGTLKLWQRFEKDRLEEELIYTHSPGVVECTGRTYFDVWNERRCGETIARGYFENDRLMAIDYCDMGLWYRIEHFYAPDGLIECVYDSHTNPDGTYTDITWRQLRDSGNRPVEITVTNNGQLIIRVTFVHVEK